MQCLSKAQVLRLHEDIVAVSGGSAGLRDEGALDSALAQPFASFGGQDLYPTLIDKAAALGFSLINNHPFIDGNKLRSAALLPSRPATSDKAVQRLQRTGPMGRGDHGL